MHLVRKTAGQSKKNGSCDIRETVVWFLIYEPEISQLLSLQLYRVTVSIKAIIHGKMLKTKAYTNSIVKHLRDKGIYVHNT